MKLFDFSKRFSRAAQAWMNQNSGKYKPEELEEKLPDLYIRWLNTPASWLDGDTPNAYFGRFTDEKVLVGMLLDYCRANVAVPDPLFDRLAALGDATAPLLAKLMLNGAAPEKARELAGSLLVEIGKDLPMQGCIALIADEAVPESVREQAAAVLRAAGQAAEAELLSAAEHSDGDVRSVYLDVLLDCSRDERLLAWILYGLHNQPEKRTVYVSYLLRLGDERALEPLQKMLLLTDLGYVEFLEISNVIESLGGEVTVQREFAGDADYEVLRNTDDGESSEAWTAAEALSGMEPDQKPDV